MNTYIENKEIRKVVIRVPKEHSSFFYFTMEANEGAAFYSTLPDSLGKHYRDISVSCTPEFSDDVDQIMKHFQTRYPLEVISDEIVSD